MKQRISEWFEVTEEYKHYHERQLKGTYRSTIIFCDWLEEMQIFKKDSVLKIIDIGAGQGANIFYMSKRYPKSTFVGIDFNPPLVRKGNEYFRKMKVRNCILKLANLYKLDKSYIGKYDGVVSYQTLSWLPDFKTPIKKMIALKPRWIALTSLFFDGGVNAKIQIQDYTTPLKSKPYTQRYYNVYSIPLVKELLRRHGYPDFRYKSFEIDIDLPRPLSSGMGTYTEKLASGRRIQISGPLLMNWYFIYAGRQC